MSSNPTTPTQLRSLLYFTILILLWFAVPDSANALNFGQLSKHGTPSPAPFYPSAKAPQATQSKMAVRLGGAVKRTLARVTVYWAKEDKWSRRHRSATGIRLHRNVVAVDPRIIPYGSHIRFPDAVCHAIDTGSAVKSRKAARKAGRTVEEKAAIVVDRFFETKREALAWARLYPPFMALDIIPPMRTF